MQDCTSTGREERTGKEQNLLSAATGSVEHASGRGGYRGGGREEGTGWWQYTAEVRVLQGQATGEVHS